MSEGGTETGSRIGRIFVREDSVAGVVIFVALLLFVGTGSQVVPAALRDALQASGGSDRIATVALLLNIALILVAWRRYKEVRSEAARRRLAEARAEILASRDHLTNLLVRRSIGEAGDVSLADALAHGGTSGMLVVDLDRFKNVNDVYGHMAGDMLLRAIAERLLASVPDEALTARVGADEFCVLVPLWEPEPGRLNAVADLLLARLAQPVEVSGIKIHVRLSIGIAQAGEDCSSVDALLRRATIAMQEAKKAGGHQAVWFDSSMESVLKARNEVEAGLRRGIPLGEFVPFYQPQVDLASGALVGFEVLARWNHPAGGTVGPDLFIPVAEETGLIDDLFDSVFAQALSEARDWHPSLSIAVNVSPGQLKDPWLAHRILKMLTEAGFPAERLEIEITESSLFENLALAQAIVTSLKNQGVRLALDDFGTGYSSLAHLRALPFDRIKIDRSFVQAMSRDRSSLAIVTAIARMAESVGVPVTAEGVEETEAVSSLLAIGCEHGQGWLFGKPVSGVDTVALLYSNGLIGRPDCAPKEAPPLAGERPAGRRSAA